MECGLIGDDRIGSAQGDSERRRSGANQLSSKRVFEVCDRRLVELDCLRDDAHACFGIYLSQARTIAFAKPSP
jgi:hypothetical protein